ncbi:hypothetical protein ANAPRD1_00317 [Anaplasma phagocytophilum]|uniref:zinc-ribbon domain-containing protein n=1 Tax=Anaplasma phagocytophilum TaxID=948 RepID=UPI0007E1C60D|nr:zinc-ribbon domain-containing protein [Anaplasma phagocytophilum]SCV62975.1 hypothetical protein ANAPRD1_00317 [Anaplasma phagocytophilum]
MIRVVCTNCSAVYSVAGARIPKKGKEVKCSHCHHTWLFMPENVSIPSKGPPGGKKERVEKFFGGKTLIQMMILFPLLFFFSSSFQDRFSYTFRKIYRLTEIYDTSDIKLRSSGVEVLEVHGDGTMQVRVRWIIINNADKERFVPDVRFTFYDENQKSVFSKKIEVDKYNVIKSKTGMHFERVIEGVSSSANTVQVRAGNAFEIFF